VTIDIGQNVTGSLKQALGKELELRHAGVPLQNLRLQTA
jgi:hypothetical protein